MGRRRRRACFGGILTALCAAGIVLLRAVAADPRSDRILYLRVATALVPPSGRALTGGIDEVWMDWRGGTAFSRSIAPGESAPRERWYRRVGGYTQTWTLQVDGRALSDGGASPWDDPVLTRSVGGLAGLRARYTRLLRMGGRGAPGHGGRLVRLSAGRDLLPAPLPGVMMQRGSVVWLDTRTRLPIVVMRALLPYIAGSRETEICRVAALGEIRRSDAPAALDGPPGPTIWASLTDLAAGAWRRVVGSR